MLSYSSKTRNQIVFVWIATFLLIYYFVWKRTELETWREIRSSSLSTSLKLDCVVYVAMGKMAAESTIDYSIHSMRKLGKYMGDIYVITDSPACFSYWTQQDKNFKLLEISPLQSIIKIKALKTHILDYIPIDKRSVLYLDVDIIISKPIHSFIYDVNKSIKKLKSIKSSSTALSTTASMVPTANSTFSIDLGAFYDAKGHYVGYCGGCEKWHSGVLLLERRKTATASAYVGTSAANANTSAKSSCLEAWENILLSGKFQTDQQSLDEAEAQGHCPSILPLPSNHLLFAKDYIGWFFTSGHTFIHVTGIGRLHEQDYFYTNVVVPNLRGTFHLPYEKEACPIGTGKDKSTT